MGTWSSFLWRNLLICSRLCYMVRYVRSHHIKHWPFLSGPPPALSPIISLLQAISMEVFLLNVRFIIALRFDSFVLNPYLSRIKAIRIDGKIGWRRTTCDAHCIAVRTLFVSRPTSHLIEKMSPFLIMLGTANSGINQDG